mmetsp:Transcript_10333/g.34211  ORF Transcript_10333/g.34211 Transcript_10333/m.34211 type:complete len:260 (-) Transcript_10333:1652-2431(-)|eukprot:scaffold5866_cov93-Isochrysis_galbana.AAC.13
MLEWQRWRQGRCPRRGGGGHGGRGVVGRGQLLRVVPELIGRLDGEPFIALGVERAQFSVCCHELHALAKGEVGQLQSQVCQPVKDCRGAQVQPGLDGVGQHRRTTPTCILLGLGWAGCGELVEQIRHQDLFTDALHHAHRPVRLGCGCARLRVGGVVGVLGAPDAGTAARRARLVVGLVAFRVRIPAGIGPAGASDCTDSTQLVAQGEAKHARRTPALAQEAASILSHHDGFHRPNSFFSMAHGRRRPRVVARSRMSPD